MQLTEHFALAEFTASQTALRRGLPNDPNPPQVENLRTLAHCLEACRDILGGPIIITSGFRSPQLNARVGGFVGSHHCQGLAADFVCPSYGDAEKVSRRLNAGLFVPFDQLIWEPGWVHLSVHPNRRRQFLRAVEDPQRGWAYVDLGHANDAAWDDTRPIGGGSAPRTHAEPSGEGGE